MIPDPPTTWDPGDAGAHCRLAATALADGGWHVHVLYCGAVDEPDGVRERFGPLSDARIDVTPLEAIPPPAWLSAEQHGGYPYWTVMSQQVLEALQALDADDRFDLIEFPDRGGLGFRPVQAKRLGLAFPGAALGVKLISPMPLRRELDLAWISAPRELELEYCERYAFERADVQLSASQAMVDGARMSDWKVRDDIGITHALAPSPVDARQRELEEPVSPGIPHEIREEPRARDLRETYERVLERYRRPRRQRPRPTRRATVTVAVTHHNHAAYLPMALDSLAAQTREPDEVIVIDDGSTDARSVLVFEEQRRRFEGWRFVRQANAGPGAARNACLAKAGTDYFLPFDSDNIARPSLVEGLAGAVEAAPDLDAVACHLLAFETDADREAGRYIFRYSPTGGPLLHSAVENVYGDACSLFRADALRGVGGFGTDGANPWEDWDTFVKLAVAGHELDVLPAALVEYRHRDDGRSMALLSEPGTDFLHHRRRLDSLFVDAPLKDGERRSLWECLLGFHHLADVRLPEAHARLESTLERLADAEHRCQDLEAELRSAQAARRDLRRALRKREHTASRGYPARHRAADWAHERLGRVPGYPALARLLKRYTAV